MRTVGGLLSHTRLSGFTRVRDNTHPGTDGTRCKAGKVGNGMLRAKGWVGGGQVCHQVSVSRSAHWIGWVVRVVTQSRGFRTNGLGL